jgi:plastocyanin
MIKIISKFSIFTIFSLILISCGGGGGGGESDSTYPVTPSPTASLSSSASDVLVNETVTLTWNSSNATACSASGSWTGDIGTSGNQSIQITSFGANTFNINCSGATASTTVTSSIDFDIDSIDQTNDYGIVEVSISGYILADGQQEDMSVIQTSGTDILWLTKESSSKYSFRAPIINTTEEISLDVTLGLSGISETTTKEIKINIEPQRNELLGLSLSEFPGGSQNDGWPTLITDYYKTWNFPSGVIHETAKWTGRYCYPTANNCYDGDDSAFGLASPNYGIGDFNGDGYEDVVLAAFNTPRHLDEVTYPDFVILLNDGNGRLSEDKNFYADGVLEAALPYRLGIADFNGDGLDDFVSCSRVNDLADDYTYVLTGDVYDLFLTNSEGKMVRSSENIDTSDSNSKSIGCHDASVGDVNGDGFPDFFISAKLFLNDGSGNFTYKNVETAGPLSSNIADVNADGYGDLIMHFGDPALGAARGGEIILSNGSDDIDSWEKKYLPNEIFIGNTRVNHSNFGDLDGDGDIDLIVGNTRQNPYYDGRKVSILINDGTGNFTDATSTLIPYTQSREPVTEDGDAVGGGEGEVYIRDWDGDGDLDIIDAWQPDNGSDVPAGVMVFINKIEEDGTFHEIDQSYFPEAVTSYALTGREGVNDGGSSGDGYITIRRGAPINLDNKGNLDFVVKASSISLVDTGYDGVALFFYTLVSTKQDDTNGGSSQAETIEVSFEANSNGSGNVYVIDGTQKKALTLNVGTTYTFNHSSSHPFRFSTTADGTHGGGSEYTGGVTKSSGVTTIEVTSDTPTALYYYCDVHSGMGAGITIN